MSANIKLVKSKNVTGMKSRLKKIKDSDGFIAITLKREGFITAFDHARHSISDEEIIYAMENLKLQLLLRD